MDAKSDIMFVKTLKLMAAYISGFTVSAFMFYDALNKGHLFIKGQNCPSIIPVHFHLQIKDGSQNYSSQLAKFLSYLYILTSKLRKPLYKGQNYSSQLAKFLSYLYILTSKLRKPLYKEQNYSSKFLVYIPVHFNLQI